MALVVKDRVQEITSTTGTGTVTLGGAVLGYQSFSTIGNGNTTYYTIVDLAAGDWEVGIGTYTSSGTTLSRDTVLSSSNAGSLVPFGVGTKNVFVTYPSERSVYLDQPGSYPVQSTFNSLTAATATLTSGTITTVPSSGTDITNKDYVDSIASGLNYHQPVNYASVAALPSYVYNNGTLGVGATITASANGALSFGGGSPTAGQRLLVKDETGGNAPYNGIYTVTSAGSAGSKFQLTRATDYDSSGSGTNEVDAGDYVLVISGTNASTAWVQQTPLPIVIGTTALTFLQFNAPITYNAGTGLNLSPATTFNISNTGVTATTYGSASQVPVMAINAQGQVTSATNTAIAIAAGAVSGLAASATTDTTNASNISSGTLGTARLSGSYTGITGVGTLTAGTWNGSTIGAGYGGTGFSSYAVGDLLYADTTSTLAKLADVAVGNALISGGVGAAPSWGKIGLATHVSGTLPIANGGTGSTSTTFVNLTTNVTGTLPVANGGTGVDSTTTTAKFFFAAPNASAGSPTFRAIVASDIPTLNQNTTGSAATLTTPRAIYGNNFDGSAALNQIIASTYGGTGNGFTKFSGATTTEKTYTLPDATCSILTSNAAVTVAQGGTGLTSTPSNGQLDIGNGTGFTRATLTQGSGITITNGAGTITIASSVTSPIPSGTVMIFKQTAAPTGWTKDTTAALNDSALRIVTGAASTGGTVAFTTAFASQSVSGTLSSTTATNQNTTAGGSVSSSSSSGLTTATNQATTAGGSISGSVGTSGAYTLTTSDIPAHAHVISNHNVGPGAGPVPVFYRTGYGNSSTDNTGGGLGHSHSGGSFSGSFSGSSHNHTQDAHNHSISTSSSFTGTAHTHTQDAHSHTFTGTAINLAVKYIDFIIASKD